MPGGELLHLHIGQTGVESAGPCWAQLAEQHGVSATDGTVQQPSAKGGAMRNDDINRSKLFVEGAGGHWSPRAVVLDTDPWVTTAVKRSTCATLFAPANVVAGKQDTGANFAIGRYTFGRDFWKETAADIVRRNIEACDALDSVVLYHSTCGGTGGGLTTLILEELGSSLASKAHRIAQSTFPSPNMPTSTLESYNALLGIGSLTELAHMASCVQTEAVHTLCKSVGGADAVTTAAINGVTAAAMNALHQPLHAANPRLSRSIFDLRDHLVNGTPLVMPGIAWSQPGEDLGAVAARAMSPAGSLLVPVEALRAALLPTDNVSLPRREEQNPAENVGKAAGKGPTKRPMNYVAWSISGTADTRATFSALDAAQKAAGGAATSFGAVSIVEDQVRPVATSSRLPLADVSDVCIATTASKPHALGASVQLIANRFDAQFKSRAFAHWYVREGLEEGEFYEAREQVATAITAIEGGDDNGDASDDE